MEIILFFKKSEKNIGAFSKELFRSAEHATKLYFTPIIDHIPKKSEEIKVDRSVFVGVLFEFICFLVYTANVALLGRLEKERSDQIIKEILGNCISFIDKEIISDWPPNKRKEFPKILLLNYGKRASEYTESDRKYFEEKDNSVTANYIYLFAKEVARISGRGDNLKAILEASALANSISQSEYPFKKFRIPSFVKSIK